MPSAAQIGRFFARGGVNAIKAGYRGVSSLSSRYLPSVGRGLMTGAYSFTRDPRNNVALGTSLVGGVIGGVTAYRNDENVLLGAAAGMAAGYAGMRFATRGTMPKEFWSKAGRAVQGAAAGAAWYTLMPNQYVDRKTRAINNEPGFYGEAPLYQAASVNQAQSPIGRTRNWSLGVSGDVTLGAHKMSQRW